jgi:8-oxo-dGTP diphosphatase
MATPRVAAGALVRDPTGRVLLGHGIGTAFHSGLVRPTYKAGWDVPGGYVEPGETPSQACRRELDEEIGLRLRPGRLLVVDWAPHPEEGDKVLFDFDGGILADTDALVPDGTEIAEARFHALSDLAAWVPDRLVRRLSLAAVAIERGSTIYAEHGAVTDPAGHRTP